ncbi:MAG: hypothetical protein WAM58_18940 [Candidatus Acidiferrum sp.]
MKVLISGAGIAGPTLAYWLAHHGMEPTVVEIAPQLRTGGYVIDFWGLGFEIAGRMGLLPEIRREGYMVTEVRIVDRTGERIAGFPAEVFARVARGGYTSLARGDLAATIFGKIEGKVREIVFGPQNQFEKYLGYKVAAFEVPGYRPRDELVYVMYTEVGQQVGRFAMREDRTMFLFIFADQEIDGAATGDLQARKALLRMRFGRSGWECPQILDALDSANELYFDRVSQISMGAQTGSWTRGRVTLLGDAASCVSLLAGQGSALAMVAAYVLAGELHCAGGDYKTAFAQYQHRLQTFVLNKQKGALRFAGTFAPKSKFSMFLRNKFMSLLRIPWVADRVAGRGLADDLVLPKYQ